MSSAVYLSWDTDEGVSGGDWVTFCERHGIVYSPRTIGRNVFYANGHGGVEVTFGKADYDADGPPDYAEQITFSTYHGGSAIPDVARLATAFWLVHGGRLSADPEIRRWIVSDAAPRTSQASSGRWWETPVGW